MNEEILIDHCAPTLASMKAASLFTFYNTEDIDVEKMIFEWNNLLNEKSVYVEILKQNKSSIQIYTYRPHKLKYVLNNPSTKKLLTNLGYDTNRLDKCIDHLKKRIKNQDFPHEIGIFLDYPYEDVIGFINNKGHKFIACGYWKVYDNYLEKIKLFNTYTKIRNSYKTLFNSGMNISQLTVKQKDIC